MDEFEELYRQSPVAKRILYEQSVLFQNKTMSLYSSEQRRMTRPEACHSQWNLSSIEFETTVLMKQLTPNTCHSYRRTSFLSPKAKLIQSMKDSLNDEDEDPTKVVSVLKKTNYQIRKSRNESIQQTKNHVPSKELLDTSTIRSSKRISEQKEKNMLNGIKKSLRSLENYETVCTATVSLGQVDKCSSNKIVPSFAEPLLNGSIAKNLTADLVAANMHDRAEFSPTSAELNKKYRMSKLLINVNKLSTENVTHEKSNLSADVENQNGLTTTVPCSCVLGSLFENNSGSDRFNGLARNLIEFRESTACESSAGATANDSVSRNLNHLRQVKGKVNNVKTKNKKELNVSAGIPENNDNICNIKDECLKKKSDKTTIVLTDWSLRAVGHSKEIYVEGHRPQDGDDEYWHSSSILKRITSMQLVTCSGTTYILSGLINQEMSLEYGFSNSLVKKFRFGFPRNWKHLMQTELSHKSVDPDEFNTPFELKTPVTYESPVIEAPLDVTPVSHRKTTKITTKQSSIKTSQTLSLKDLPTSSRGRLIKPPLAYWAGQRLRLNVSNLDIVEIVPGTSNFIGISDSPISLALHEKTKVINRDVIVKRCKSSRISKKTKEKKDVTISDTRNMLTDSDFGFASDSRAISKSQSQQFTRKSTNSKVSAKSKRLITGSLKTTGGKELYQSQGLSETPKVSQSLHTITPTTNNIEGRILRKSKDPVVLETPKCSISRAVGIDSISDNGINVSPVGNIKHHKAKETSSSDTPMNRPQQRLNLKKNKIADEKNKSMNNKARSNCQEADEKRRVSLRKKAFLTTVDPAINIQPSKNNYKKKQVDHLEVIQEVEVIERNNGHVHRKKKKVPTATLR